MDNDFSWYVSKIYDWLVDKTKKYIEKTRKGVRPYVDDLIYYYRLFKKRLYQKWESQWKKILRYGALSFIPYVLAYGTLLNLVTHHFLSLSLNLTSVVAHGLLWYFLKEELFGEMIPELRPTLTADVKVKNR